MAELDSFMPHSRLHSIQLPFDDVSDLPGEIVRYPARGADGDVAIADAPDGISLEVSSADGGEAIADVADGMCLEGGVPVQIMVTNYRLKFYEPTKEGATLEVTVCGATNLIGADYNGYSDPYAVVSLTGCNHRSFRCPKQTAIIQKNLNPTWNETFSFAGVSPEACLRIELFDWDMHSKDDALGEVIVPDVALFEDGVTKTWSLSLPVMQGVKEQGMVQLRLRRIWLAHHVDVRHTSIPLTCIEESKLQMTNPGATLEIHTKSARLLRVLFDDAGTARAVEKLLNEKPEDVESFFCNVGKEPPYLKYVFSWADMLRRLAAEDGPTVRGQRTEDAAAYRARWLVDGEVNAGHGLCDSYPDKVLLPVALPRDALESSAKFRTKHRFPCVAWLHPSNGAMLVRCSQPQIGFGLAGKMSGKHKGDWDCLQHFAAPGHDGRLTICDCRPYQNAEANRMKGGGTEYDMGVEGFHMKFLEIGNIHEMRNSLAKLREGVCQLRVCHVETQKAIFKTSFTAISEWLFHLHLVITGAVGVADAIESGETVVVHCSDGWDRTSQIVSLASLLLDGHYRTIAGFPELIEKDWLRLGHKFADRHGLKSKQDQAKGHEESSPIFLQFIDCIAQIWHAFPHFFEYTVEFLAFVLYHSLSARFGNFLGNCEKQRSNTSPCLWTELLADPDRWRNPQYDPSSIRSPLSPCYLPMQKLIFQQELYARQCQMWQRESTSSPSQRVRDSEERKSHDASASPYQRKSGLGSLCPAGASPFEPERATLKNFAAPPEDSGSRVATLPDDLQAAEDFLRRFLMLPEYLRDEPRVEIKEHRALADHVEYVIKTRAGSSSYEVARRYSQFCELNKALLACPRMRVGAVFPSRTIFPVGQRTIEARVNGLNSWLQAVVETLVAAEKSCFPM